MSLVTLLGLVVAIALLWWLLMTYLPIPEAGKRVVNVICILLLVLLAIGVFLAVLTALGLDSVRIGYPPKG